MTMGGDRASTGTGGPTRRDLIVRFLGLAVVALLLWWALTRLVSWNEVVRVMGDLAVGDWTVITGVAIARLAIEPLLLMAATPGMRWPTALPGYLAPAAAVSIIPGPSDIAMRYAMYRSWGYSAAQTGASVVLVFLYPLFARIALPVMAVGVLAAFGRSDARLVTVAMIATGVLVAAVVLLALILRSEATARRLGRTVGRAAERVASVFRMQIPPTLADDLAERAVHFRERTGDVVETRTHLAAGAAAIGQLALFGVLLASLRVVGIGADELDWVTIFAAFALVQLVTSIPITPSGLGVAEAAYIALLTTASSSELAEEVAAGAIVYRLFGWIIVIPLGGLAFAWWNARPAARRS